MPTLQRAEDRIDVPDRLPVIALRDLVFFPYMVLPLLIGRPRSVAALEEAREGDGLVLLVAQRKPSVDDPASGDLFRIGTVARVIQVSSLPDGTARVVLEGLGRARIRRLGTTSDPLRASVTLLRDREAETDEPTSPALRELAKGVIGLYAEYARMHERIPDELPGILAAEGDRIRLAHLVSGHLILPSVEKQELLEAGDPIEHFSLLREMLVRELEILRIEAKLDRQIQLRLVEGAQDPDASAPVPAEAAAALRGRGLGRARGSLA